MTAPTTGMETYDWFPAEQTAALLARLTDAGIGATLQVRTRGESLYLRVVPATRVPMKKTDGTDCDDINNSLRCPPICDT